MFVVVTALRETKFSRNGLNFQDIIAIFIPRERKFRLEQQYC